MNKTQEALKMTIDLLECPHITEKRINAVVDACKEALERQDTYKLALENILHGSLLDKHNRNDDGMLDANRWGDAGRHLDTWIKTAKDALNDQTRID